MKGRGGTDEKNTHGQTHTRTGARVLQYPHTFFLPLSRTLSPFQNVLNLQRNVFRIRGCSNATNPAHIICQ